MADSMLINGLSHSSDLMRKKVSSISFFRFLPSAKARTPSASQYEASTGMPSRMCSAATPFMMAWSRVSSCQVPCPGVMTNELPPSRAMPAWKDARVRKDGLKKINPRILPASACGCGLTCSDCASARSERVAAQPRHAGLERCQGAQGRIEENQSEDLARERVRLRLDLQRLRQRPI